MELPYEMARRSLNIQPTLTERLGLPVRIIVNHDLILLPYQPMVSNQGTAIRPSSASAPSQVLVVYYSYSGNTRQAAENLALLLQGDLYEIKPL